MEKMLEKNEYCEAVVNELRSLTTADVIAREVPKNNVLLHGVSICEEGSKISPTIYIDRMYEDELPAKDAATKVFNIYLDHKDDSLDFDLAVFKDWEWVKEHLSFQIVNTAENEALLKNTIHEEILDLSLIPHVVVGKEGKEIATIKVQEAHLPLWGISADEVIQTAKENSPKLLPATLKHISDVLKEMMPEMADSFDMPELPLHVLTNECACKGAATIFYPGKLRELYETFGTFAVLPSSVHEVLIHPLDDKSKLSELTELVNLVNGEEVAIEDRLGDHAYFFDGESLTF